MEISLIITNNPLNKPTMNTQFLKTSQSEIYIPTPFGGMYHIASIIYANAHDEDPLPDTIYQDLVSALQDLETLNSYYKLNIINLTRLSNNQLLGTLIYTKRPRSIYPGDHNNPILTPRIMKYILKELPILDPLGTYTTNATIIENMELPKILTVNVTFK